MFSTRTSVGIGLICVMVAGVGSSRPVLGADYYARKTIEFVVGGGPGGGIDLYARTIARHLGRHIPGGPKIIVKNMPGTGSAKAGYHVSTIAPRDGLSIAVLLPGAIVGPLLDEKADTSFDSTKAVYIGTANAGVIVCGTLDHSKTKTFEDALKQKTIIGGASPGNAVQDFAYLVKRTTGAQFEVISGYPGAVQVALAMERREVEGICWTWSSLKSTRPDWITAGKLNLLVQLGLQQNAELTRMGVPPIWRYVTNDESRKVAKAVLTQLSFERPYMVALGTAPEHVTTLRTAFDATMRDPQFVAEAEKLRIEIAPLSGSEVEGLVRKLHATPKIILEQARAAIRP